MELEILKWIDATFHSQTWLNYIMSGITWLGEFGLAGIVLALILLVIPKTRWAGVAVSISLFLVVIFVNIILKNIVNRPRPWTEWEEIKDFYASVGVRMPSDTSFPSGHASVCFAAAVAFTFRYRIKAIPALIVAALVALSRIYLCVHFPTDVLGGIIIGIACGIAAHYTTIAIQKGVKKKRESRKKLQ